MRNKIKLILLFTVIFSNNIFSKGVEFYAKSSRQEIGEYEKFNLQFSINGNPQKFIAPSFKNFTVVSGPSQSSSTYTKIINGKYEIEKNITYSYTLIPKKKGKLSIGKATIYINGKYYKTKPLTIKVLAQKDLPKDINSPLYKARKNIHLDLELSRNNPYIGEQIVATYKLYFNVNINSPQIISNPSFDGFLNSEIKLYNNRNAKKGNYKEMTYNEFVIRKVILTPNKSGRIKIEPYKLEVPVQIPTGEYDWFGQALVKTKNIVIANPVRYVNVKPLPSNNKPNNFKGAIGNFDIRFGIDKTNLKENESIQLKVTISGKGNMNSVKIPEFSIPSELEMYDPKESRNIKTTSNGISGNITKEYLIVPRYKGEYKIPSIEFSFFDIKIKKYKTIGTKELKINVAQGDGNFISNNISNSANNQIKEKSKVEYIGEGISYIKEETSLSNINKETIFSPKSLYLYIMYFLPFLSIAGFSFIEKRREEGAKDIVGYKKKKALKIIKTKLKQVKLKMDKGENKEFFEELEIALYNFIGDKYSIPKSEMTRDYIIEILEKNKLDTNTTNDLLFLLDECEMAKYSPILDSSKINNIYNKSKEIIIKIS